MRLKNAYDYIVLCFETLLHIILNQENSFVQYFLRKKNFFLIFPHLYN